MKKKKPLRNKGKRIIGHRKFKMLCIAAETIEKLRAKGVNVKFLSKLYDIDKPERIPTKKWPGLISELKLLLRQESCKP